MRALRIRAADAGADAIAGRVLAHDVGPGLRKGHVLEPADLPRVAGLEEFHVIELEPGDVHEDAAAVRLAGIVAGPGVEASGPVQSQVRLSATRRGLLRAAVPLVDGLNRLPHLGVFTIVDGQAVEAGDEVAGCKVVPVAVPGAVLEEAAELVAGRPVVEVVAFRPLRTTVIVTERLRPAARAAFTRAVSRKLGWFGAELAAVREVARTGPAVREAYAQAGADGSALVMFAGASSIDPLDAAYAELQAAGGEVLKVGAPSHPGSMLWLGRLGPATVLGVASCAGFGRETALDLVLPFVFAYGRAEPEDFVRLGHGGLVEASAGRRFPPYG